MNWLPGADRADHVLGHRVWLRLGERDGGRLHDTFGALAARPRPPNEFSVAEGDFSPIKDEKTEFDTLTLFITFTD